MLISILKKIRVYENAEPSFMSLCLFVISMILALSFMVRANKLFFNKNDIELTAKFPIRNREIIISKLLFLFGNYYVVSFIFTYPMFVAYGIITKAKIAFYFITLFYPLFTFFFDMGLALVLLCPYTLLKKSLKNNFKSFHHFSFIFHNTPTIYILLQILISNNISFCQKCQ